MSSTNLAFQFYPWLFWFLATYFDLTFDVMESGKPFLAIRTLMDRFRFSLLITVPLMTFYSPRSSKGFRTPITAKYFSLRHLTSLTTKAK